jgi:hypothetical protein
LQRAQMFRELRNVLDAAEAQNFRDGHSALPGAFGAIVQFFFILALRFPA